MKIAFPSMEESGLESPVYNHFGTAKVFVVVDTESGALEVLGNLDLDHAHNQCQPLKALGGNRVDAVAVGGIGMGALRKLKNEGITVFRSAGGTVGENLERFKQGTLEEYPVNKTCSGHDPFGQCVH